MSRLVNQEIDALSKVFRAFSEPLRLRAYARLQEGECSAGDLALALGSARNRLSPHLKILLDSGFIQMRRVGRQRLYALKDRNVCDLLAQGRRTALQVLIPQAQRAA